MKHLLMIVVIMTTLACTETNSNPTTNISGSLINETNNNLLSNLDSLYLPTPGNGIKHITPKKDFSKTFDLFQELLLHFKHVELPYELDALVVDRTDEEWKNTPQLDKKFYAYLMDKQDFATTHGVLNPREGLEDFYKIYPVAKLSEKEYYNTLIYVIRYLDGNGQQDFFYLSTYNSNGIFLSAIEIGALEASAHTYIKTAQINAENIVKVHHADYNESTEDWVKTSESQYFLDDAGQVYGQYENKSVGASKGKEGSLKSSFMKMSDFQNYFQSFQKEIRNNSPMGILNYITFPHLRVSYEEHYQDIKTQAEFIRQYDIIFNESLRKKIIRQDFNDLIFDEEQIGLSDGSMWFKRIGKDNNGQLIVSIRVN